MSHFRMLRDNLRITWMHTRLVPGVLVRIPHAVAPEEAPAERDREAEVNASGWSRQRERGTILGIRLLLWLLRVVGQRLTSICLVPVVLYYCLTAPRARRASRQYLDRLAASGPSPVGPASLWTCFKHQWLFAVLILERTLLWQGMFDKFRFTGGKKPFLALTGEKGVLLLGAHMGSFDALRVLSQEKDIMVNVVMNRANAQKINTVMKAIDARSNLRVVEMSAAGIDTVYQLKERIDRGELVAVLGDRFPPGKRHRVCRARFCGEEAPFPQNPWLLASLLRCPVYLTVALRSGYRRYDVYFEKLADQVILPRAKRVEGIAELTARYAARLEELCRIAPLQWFNFFDFWSLDDQKDDSAQP